MASIITATTTSGLTQSADNSGVLQLASGTGNLVTVPSVTGTMALYADPQVTVYTSGSGTYTTPTGAKYLYIEMVGGGGGGGGSGVSSGGTGGTGGNSTFGSSLLTANGGVGGANGAIAVGGAGGTATVSNPAIGATFTGGEGGPSTDGSGTAAYVSSCSGGSGIFGGGVGGGGIGGFTLASGAPGSGGGAGGGIKAYITSPSSTYSYAVGAAGAAGSAGTSGGAGSVGTAGAIFITAYFG